MGLPTTRRGSNPPKGAGLPGDSTENPVIANAHPRAPAFPRSPTVMLP